MSKSKNNETNCHTEKSPKRSPGKRRRFITAAIFLGLIITGGAFAQWSSLWSVPPKSEQKVTAVVPASFSTPSKEYIYAGGKLVATDEPVSSSCSYSISPSSQSFPGNGSISGGNGSLTVTTAAGCSWTALSNASFITIISGSNGTGNGTVIFTVTTNSTTSNRSGTITVAGLTFTVLQGAAFLDVFTNLPFYVEIGKLSARGVTTGCGGGNYCPDQLVTREQMAAFLLRALGEFNPPAPPVQRFLDVPPSNPFYNFIDRMAVLNITLGCGGGNYCPAQPVTREQMAAFILRAKGEFNPPTPGSQRFNDVPPSNPFYNFIDRMAVLNITQGCSQNPPLYCPGEPVTRGQMAAFLVRAFNL